MGIVTKNTTAHLSSCWIRPWKFRDANTWSAFQTVWKACIYYAGGKAGKLNVNYSTILGQQFSMSLTNDQKKRLRNVAHKLNPIVTVGGNGLSENVQLEVDRALEDHELIKVKFAVGDRDLKRQLIKELVDIVEAQLIQEIGNIAVLFRPSDEPNPKLSNLMR